MLCTIFFVIFAMFQFFTSNGSIATEPVCSKFSYEEKMLEKMIRTEIKVETMQNEMKKTEDNVLKSLEETKKTASDINDKFEDLNNNLTGEIASKLKELQEEEDHFSSKFEELKNNISKEMEKEKETLAKLKEQMSQPTVAFHVHNVKDLILDVKDEILVFQTIITNEGSGYDKSTGIFTSPIGGVYHFTVHVCSSRSKHSPIGLVLDGTFIAKSIHYDTYACGSVGAIVKMTSGEQVWVTSTSYNTNYVLETDYLHAMNTFSGFLIST